MQNGFLFFSYNGREQMLKNLKQKDEKMALFYNRATLSYNGQNLNSNQVSGEIIEALTMTKTAITGTYGVGDSISYAISIVNSGATAIN
jgi:hypothetical protein